MRSKGKPQARTSATNTIKPNPLPILPPHERAPCSSGLAVVTALTLSQSMEDFMSKSNKPASGKAKSPKRMPKAPRGSRNKTEWKATPTRAVPKEHKPAIRESSKLAKVIAMLRQPNGASIEALSKATGWQTHSVRGAISGAIKNKLGLTVTSTKADGVRTYRIND